MTCSATPTAGAGTHTGHTGTRITQTNLTTPSKPINPRPSVAARTPCWPAQGRPLAQPLPGPLPPRPDTMYPTFKIHASLMYPTCILIASQDTCTCIPHVSRMYLEFKVHASLWMHSDCTVCGVESLSPKSGGGDCV